MEGLHILPDLVQRMDWMVKLDLKDAYLQVPIHKEHQCLLQFQWEHKTYQFVCLLAVRANVSTPSVYKGYEASGGNAPAIGNTSDHISGRHLNYARLQGGTDTAHSPSMSVFPGPGTDSQPGEISTHFQIGNRVPGIPCELSLPPPSFSTREDEEDPAGCLNPHTTPISLHMRPGKICGEDISLYKGYLASTLALQGHTSYDKFCERGRTLPSEQSIQVQCQPPAHCTGHKGLAAFLALQCFTKGKSNITIQLKLDNITAVFYINRMGGTHSQEIYT